MARRPEFRFRIEPPNLGPRFVPPSALVLLCVQCLEDPNNSTNLCGLQLRSKYLPLLLFGMIWSMSVMEYAMNGVQFKCWGYLFLSNNMNTLCGLIAGYLCGCGCIHLDRLLLPTACVEKLEQQFCCLFCRCCCPQLLCSACGGRYILVQESGAQPPRITEQASAQEPSFAAFRGAG